MVYFYLLGRFIYISYFERREVEPVVTYTNTTLIRYPIEDEMSNKEEKKHVVFENPDQTLVISVV